MRWMAVVGVALFPSLASAQDGEWAFELRFQPDNTGANTTNKSVQLEDGELTIEESGETRNRYDERDATGAEAEFLVRFISDRARAADFTAGDRVPRPHVEVIFEWNGEIREIEITEVYPAGEVPAEIVAAQEMFFDDVYE